MDGMDGLSADCNVTVIELLYVDGFIGSVASSGFKDLYWTNLLIYSIQALGSSLM
jgi:hypothetical protein